MKHLTYITLALMTASTVAYAKPVDTKHSMAPIPHTDTATNDDPESLSKLEPAAGPEGETGKITINPRQFKTN